MIYQTISDCAHEHPSKTAVVYNGDVISYAAFASAIDETCGDIETQTLPEGHTIVVRINCLMDCWVAVLALQNLGFNTVCVSSVSVIEGLSLHSIGGIVTTEIEARIDPIEPDYIKKERIISIPNPTYSSGGPPLVRASKGKNGIGDHILYTSGTTGTYKKIVTSANQQKKRDAERIQQMHLSEDTVFYCSDYGLWTAVGYMLAPSTWKVNGCVILDQRPDWRRHFLHSGVTRAVLLPDKLNQLLSAMDDNTEMSSPENFTLYASGGFISRSLAQRILDRLTKNLFVSYGSTEVAIASLESKVTDLDDLHWLAPSPVRRVEIIDDSGAVCRINEEGYIRIRLEAQDCSSYLDNPQVSAKVFRDGFFYPGDMAVRRADGRIRMLGRSADVVNFRGQKYAVSPLEDNIQNLLGVEAACLFSGLNDAGEDEVVVAIEAEQWPDKSHLDLLGHEFAQFDQIRFAIIHPFPRTTTGTEKVNRAELRKLIFPGQ